MEGTGEINEAIESSAEAPHLRRKESGSSPQLGNCNLMGSTSLFISSASDWHENLTSLRSPELVIDTLKGKNLVRHTSSQSGSESLGTSLQSMNNADVMVEELTLKNFNYPNLSLAGSSNSGDDMQVGKGLWDNFYKMVADPKGAGLKETMASENGAGAGNYSMDPLSSQRSPLQKQADQNHSNVFEHLTGGENHTILENAPERFPRGIRTKVLPASGFPQFLVKNTLKGKGIAYRHPQSYGPPGVVTQGHGNERITRGSSKGLPDTWRSLSARADDAQSLYGGGGITVGSGFPNRISLRQWLKPGKYKINKGERLHIFKQVLELVDNSHSTGVALRHLRPSYFMIFPSNQVRYTGSFVPHTHMELIEGGISQPTDHLLKRKSYLDHGNESRELPPKYQKFNEVKVGSTQNPLSDRGGFKGELAKGFDDDNIMVGSSGFDLREHLKSREDFHPQFDFGGPTLYSNNIQGQPTSEIVQLEEKWYASPEELNGCASLFTSNIYSLGVLLFELFCCFESWEVHAAAMLNLRHRILPSNFLSESPKEAGFCLWLLHPEPSSRPTSREVLQHDLISETQNMEFVGQSSALFDEEDAEAELLLRFLLSVKEQREKQTEKLVENIGCLRSDIEEVGRRHLSRIELLSNGQDSLTSLNEIYKETFHSGKQSSVSMSRINQERLMQNINRLESAYFSMRSKIELPEINVAERSDSDKDVLRSRETFSMVQNSDELSIINEPDPLGTFFDGLCKYARYNKFEVRGTLRNGDILNSANVICSLSFDRDEEYFAAAGVSKKIKIFQYASLLNDTVDIHYPVVEMLSKSKLSCVCWNGYIKNYLASTDYDGTVQLWDASTGQGFTQYTEHQKRAWSVDFSHVDPTKLASGSDDGFVKLWKINEKNSTNTIRYHANVCCVQFSAHSTNLLAFGTADYKIYCYDLRHTRIPWCTLLGHGKAVSYVKFVDSETLVSASTDNTLKLWDLNKTSSSGFSDNACSLTLSGHMNEKNFVGLSVSDGYIACGSETNEVYAYYKSLPMPITSQKFGSIDPISGQEIADDNGQFVSSVCWRGKSSMVVAANSSGSIKLLQMV